MRQREMKKRQEQEKKESVPKIEEITDDEAVEIQAKIDESKKAASGQNEDENIAEKTAKLVVGSL